MEKARMRMRGDEIQDGSRVHLLLWRGAFAAQALGQAPGPDRQTQVLAHFLQNPRDTLFFRRPDISQGTAGFEDLPDGFCGAALGGSCWGMGSGSVVAHLH